MMPVFKACSHEVLIINPHSQQYQLNYFFCKSEKSDGSRTDSRAVPLNPSSRQATQKAAAHRPLA